MAATKVRNRISENGQQEPAVEKIVISPPRMQMAQFKIRGDAPLVINRFSQKAMEMIKQTQSLGSQAKKGRKKDAKDFQALYQGARHISDEGWDGIPCSGFRAAMIDACRMANFKMTVAKCSLFCVQDGFDRVDKVGLVKITKGEPHYCEHAVRNESGVCDIRPRAMFDPGWEAVVTLRWDADQFSAQDVANLLARVGCQIGLCEGRPYSPNGAGCGWGTFALVSDE